MTSPSRRCAVGTNGVVGTDASRSAHPGGERPDRHPHPDLVTGVDGGGSPDNGAVGSGDDGEAPFEHPMGIEGREVTTAGVEAARGPAEDLARRPTPVERRQPSPADLELTAGMRIVEAAPTRRQPGSRSGDPGVEGPPRVHGGEMAAGPGHGLVEGGGRPAPPGVEETVQGGGIRHDRRRGQGGGGATEVGDLVAEGPVAVVADGGYDRHRAGRPRPGTPPRRSRAAGRWHRRLRGPR